MDTDDSNTCFIVAGDGLLMNVLFPLREESLNICTIISHKVIHFVEESAKVSTLVVQLTELQQLVQLFHHIHHGQME